MYLTGPARSRHRALLKISDPRDPRRPLVPRGRYLPEGPMSASREGDNSYIAPHTVAWSGYPAIRSSRYEVLRRSAVYHNDIVDIYTISTQVPRSHYDQLFRAQLTIVILVGVAPSFQRLLGACHRLRSHR